MTSVSSSTTINQPVDKVFNLVTSVDNHKAWQAGILEAKLTPPGPVAVGSIYHYTTEVMGRKYESQIQVSAYATNQKWSVKTTGVPRPMETVYLFEPAGNATKLTISVELVGGYPAAAEGTVKQQWQKTLDEQTSRIKQQAEK
jgi:uncharacterized protein YndB with AHSA1/START domain